MSIEDLAIRQNRRVWISLRVDLLQSVHELYLSGEHRHYRRDFKLDWIKQFCKWVPN